MFLMLNICIYGLHICIYSNFTLAHQPSCIYINTYLYICSMRPQNTTKNTLALQKSAVSMV